MAQIQIWTRDVNGTSLLGSKAPQHTFLIKINDDGTREIIRGGPINDNMIMDDVEIVNLPYTDDLIHSDYFNPSLPNTSNYQGQTVKTATQSEIDALWNKAWSKAQEINSQNYDYEPLTQNCNTTTALMAQEMGVKDEVLNFLNQQSVWTPGFAESFSHSLVDAAYDFISELPSNLANDLNTINSWLKDFVDTREYENQEVKEKFQDKYSYTIQKGDTISQIAQSLGVSQEDLILANPWLSDRASEDGSYVLIRPGEELNIPTNSSFYNTSNIGSFIQDSLNSLSSAESQVQPRRVDPLALDLDGDGLELINVRNSTAFFDLDIFQSPSGEYVGDGLKEQVGWVGSDDGLLALDRNGNGRIDNVLELFGNQTKTGTEVLREFDLNVDGVIDSLDAVFGQLKVWRDLNQDGVSDLGSDVNKPNELFSLNELGITAINLNNLTNINQVQNNNLIISQGSFTQNVTTTTSQEIINSETGEVTFQTTTTTENKTKTYSNLDLAVNQANSTSYTYEDNGQIVGDYNLRIEAFTLPILRGYGDLMPLTIAAGNDDELFSALYNLGKTTSQDYQTINQQIENILYIWAKTKDVVGLRGVYDARRLATMEALRGEVYTTANGGHNVELWQVGNVDSAWESFMKAMRINFLTQGLFREIFTNSNSSPIYDFATDTIDFGSLTAADIFANITTKFNSLTKNISTASDEAVAAELNNIYSAYEKLNFIQAIEPLLSDLRNSFGLSQEEVKSGIEQISADISNIKFGSDEDDDGIWGAVYDMNNNLIFNDVVVSAGKGNDKIIGSSGDNIYLYNKGDGRDTIDESGRGGYFSSYDNAMETSYGYDKILFGSEIKREDVYFTGGEGQLFIKFKNSPNDQIEIKYPNILMNRVEAVQFSDGSIIDLTNPNLQKTFFGDDQNNVIIGSDKPDIIISNKGFDELHGAQGNDIYVFNKGDGFDLVSEFGGGFAKIANDQGYNIATDGIFENIRMSLDNYYWNGTSTPLSQISLGENDIIEINGYNQDQIIFGVFGQNLVIQFKDSDDRIIIRDQFKDIANRIEKIKLKYLDENSQEQEQVIDLMTYDWSQLDSKIYGTLGNDKISAPAKTIKTNYIEGREGDDTINAGDSDNVVIGGLGNDKITVGNGKNYVEGNEGNDSINGGTGDDIIKGGDGDDSIDGGNGNDIIEGGRGNDELWGRLGNDIYVYNLGDGHDVITDNNGLYEHGGNDTISFGLGIVAADLNLTRQGDDLIINFINSADDSIRIKNYFFRDFSIVENLEFSVLQADGSIVKNSIRTSNLIRNYYTGTDANDTVTENNYASYYADIVDGKEGNDYIATSDGNDEITGGKGDDKLFGETGDDKYFYNLGDGRDLIDDSYETRYFWAGHGISYDMGFGDDSIVFGAGISKQNLIFTRNGNDLIINFDNDSEGQITIKNHYYFNNGRIENINFADGSVLDISNLKFINGSVANDVINSSTANEIFTGNGGHDNFIFTSTSGNDIITDFGGISNSWDFGHDMPNHDSLRFTSQGMTADKMLLSYNGSDTIITFEGIKDFSLTLQNFDFINLDNAPNGLNNIYFYGQNPSYDYNLITNPSQQDRTFDSYDVINDHTNSLNPIWNVNITTFLNEIDNVVDGLENSNDTINAAAGNDVIRGKSGNDTLRGQEGNDQLFGDEGDDKINGGIGSDLLTGGNENDIFVYTNLSDSTNTSFDTILDFVQGQDKIDLSQLNHFNSITDLEITYDHINHQTIIQDLDSDFLIKLQNEIELNQDSFVF